MIGFVTPGLRAVVRLRVLADAMEAEIDAVIDTGFSGFLTLPPHIIERLALKAAGESQIMPADGSEITTQLFDCRLRVNGATRGIVVLQTDNEPLIGMMLLENNRLSIEVRDGGAVTIEPL